MGARGGAEEGSKCGDGGRRRGPSLEFYPHEAPHQSDPSRGTAGGMIRRGSVAGVFTLQIFGTTYPPLIQWGVSCFRRFESADVCSNLMGLGFQRSKQTKFLLESGLSKPCPNPVQTLSKPCPNLSKPPMFLSKPRKTILAHARNYKTGASNILVQLN